MRLGVTMQAVEDTLYDAFGQRQISTIFGQANQYRVILETGPAWQADPATLGLLRVPGTNAAQMPAAERPAAQVPSPQLPTPQVPLSQIGAHHADHGAAGGDA